VPSSPSFWNKRRVLVTGHTGFKGSWLSLSLQMLGAEVVGYALAPPTQPNHFFVADVGCGMTSLLGDIRNADALSAVFARYRPEVVFHLAAQALVLPAYDDPATTYSTNVMGTVNLLEAVRRQADVRAVLVVTSDKCYADGAAARPCREDDRLGGKDPYSSSKACAELVCAAYRASYFAGGTAGEPPTALATARAGNAIGGGDWSANRLIPDALRAFSENRPLAVRHPAAVRPWQHVLDALAGYLVLAEGLYARGGKLAAAWNFGPAEAATHSVADVLHELVRLWGGAAAWTTDARPSRHEAAVLRLDATKAIGQLGWHPRWSLGEALAMTVEWSRAYEEGRDMAAVSRQQIARHGLVSDNPIQIAPVSLQ